MVDFHPGFRRVVICALVVAICGSSLATPPAPQYASTNDQHTGPVLFQISDQANLETDSSLLQPWGTAAPLVGMRDNSASRVQFGELQHAIKHAQYQQPILPSEQLLPQVGNSATTTSPPTTGIARTSYFGAFNRNNGARDYILGLEAKTRQSSDAGSLLGKSPTALGVDAQRRTPIITDIRVRGNRPGS